MPPGIQSTVELLTQGYGGCNTALQFSQLFEMFQGTVSPMMQNAWMPKIGAIGKRPGSIPVTVSALAADIKYLTTYKASASHTDKPEIYAASGTTLYKYDGTDSLDAMTMTDSLESSDIYTIGFTNALLTSRLIIGDGGALKGCDGTTVVDITPAADDPSPIPANALVDINAKGCVFVWSYTGHIFISPRSNEMFYSKRLDFNYFPETNYFFLVRDNDFINGCGVGYDNVCLVPMRRGWGILSGTNFNNFEADEYLNTVHGVIAPRSIQKVTYPDGSQTIIYLSDDSVHEVFTAIYNENSKLYATRDIMKEIIDFEGIGLTEAEKENAVGFFDSKRSLYLLSFKKAGVNITYAYDIRNRQWYPDWLTFNAKAYVSLDGVTYFAGDKKHLIKFDNNLYSDWNESTKTTGVPVYWKRYSALLSFEKTGYASYWDYYIIESRQYPMPSSIDVTVIFTNITEDASGGIETSSAVWDETEWDVAVWSNEDYTQTVNEPRRIPYHKKSLYVQTLLESPRDEPLEMYFEKWIGRASNL